jgi:hypothetical protein
MIFMKIGAVKAILYFGDLRLQLWCMLGLPSSGMLRSVWLFLFTDVSGQPVGHIFMGPIGCPMGSIGYPETPVKNCQHCVTT